VHREFAEVAICKTGSFARQGRSRRHRNLLGVPDTTTGGFDWSRIEAAIDAIPVGRWTTYGDLAELGGTAAQPVGNFIIGQPAGSNGYRVLSADGDVSAYFRWADPHETRDVREVLTAEGIEFQNGHASAIQRITSEELASLIDEASSDELSLDEPAVDDPLP
jgi:alkylated DNA nucleotide flippase Atl1